MSPENQSACADERPYPFGMCDGLNLHPLYRYLQEHESLARVRMPYGDAALLVTRHDDIKTVLGDTRFSRSMPAGHDPARVTSEVIPTGIAEMDPPHHTRIRRLISATFSTKRAERQRSATERHAKALLERMTAAGPPADLVEDYAVPLTVGVICDLLGVPAEDRAEFRRWIVVMDDVYTGDDPVLLDYLGKLTTYIAQLIGHRRTAPSDDLISELIQAHDDDHLTEDELIFLCLALLVAGYETTSNAIGSFVYSLLTHPGQLTLLRERPELLPGAIEELLRYTPMSVSAAFPHVATAEVKVGEQTVAPGQQLLTSINAGNRDPRVFEDPDRLDIGRAVSSHLTFGYGPHYCVGAALARMELRVALGMVLDQLPDLRLAVDASELSWKPNLLFRGLVKLPITW